MKHKRTSFEIEKDLNEYRQRMAEAVQARNFATVQVYAQRIAEVRREYDDLMADCKFFEQERNLDPHLVAWAAKTLALMLNMADMSIYYYDLYMEYHRRRGFRPVPEWERKAGALKRAAEEFRAFISVFFQGRNIDMYGRQMGDLLDDVARRCYTDRERKYLEEYEKG